MLIWGSGNKTVKKHVVDSYICPECGRADNLSVVVNYDYSHLYWIFRSVKNVRTSLVCENCGTESAADKQRQKDLFDKLGGNPISYFDRFGGVFLVMIVAAVVGFAVLSQASRDDSGRIVSGGSIDAFDIRVGDCFDDSDSMSSDEEFEVSGVRGVPCAEPHDNEVFAVFDLEFNEYPAGEEMADTAFEGCLQRFEQYVGLDYMSSSLDIYPLYPTQQSWNQLNDREVACVLFDMELAKLEGSMKGSGL